MFQTWHTPGSKQLLPQLNNVMNLLTKIWLVLFYDACVEQYSNIMFQTAILL